MNQPEPASSPSTDATWREIEQLVHEVSELSRSATSSREFYAAVLDRAVRALAAVGGAVWVRGDEGRVLLECQINLQQTPFESSSAGPPYHAQLLADVFEDKQVKVIPPQSGGPDQATNSTGLLLVLCPVIVEDAVLAIVEIFQRPGASPAAQQGYLQLLSALCDLSTDFHRQRELEGLREWSAVWGRVEQFAQGVHHSLDLEAATYTLANEGCRLIGCDRLSVLTLHGRRCRARAISGVDAVDRRATLVRCLERLAETSLAIDEPLWSDGGPNDFPPRLDEALQAYVDESHARTVAVLPIKAAPHDTGDERLETTLGALVLERFEAATDPAADRRLAGLACRHGALALRNALWHDSLPFRPLIRVAVGLRWLTRARQLPWTVLALLLTAALAAVLVLVPGDLQIESRGQLQPKTRRVVFAPNDGVVHRVHVDHAKQVAAGDVLVELRKSELDLEYTRLMGEMQTTRQQLDAVRAARLQAERSSEGTREEYEQLTAKEEELKSALASLAKQHEILLKQRDELRVLSPIAGQVLTWDIAQSLDARPVQRGQALVTVVDPSGPWKLELRVPDDQVGYVLHAQRTVEPRLDVSFILSTDPGTTYHGRIEEVAMAAETDEDSHATVLATAQIDRDAIAELRPGATVVAKIHCGRRPLGYIWFRGLIEAVRTHLLF